MKITNAASPRHEKSMRRLATFLGLEELRYKDHGIREEYFLTKDGKTMSFVCDGNRDQGGFLVVPGTHDIEDGMACGCGQPLHYTDKKLQEQVEAIVERLGATIEVEADGRRFAVPRHYIALHGIQADDLAAAAARHGFEEVVKSNVGGVK